MSRFTDPVLITDRLGVTLAAADCSAAWHGPLAGYWSFDCALDSVRRVRGDESVQDAAAERAAERYIEDHPGGLPRVGLERLGRTFGFYRPIEQIQLDVFVESHPRFWAFAGLGVYYGQVVLSVVGLILLRRRGVIVYPLLAVGANVILTVILIYGQTRFRTAVEPVLCLLTAVAIDGWRAWIGSHAPGGVRGGPGVVSERRPPAPAWSRRPSDPT